MSKTRKLSQGKFSVLKNKAVGIASNAKNTLYPSTKSFIKRRPMVSFFVVLGMLFGVIVLNSILTQVPVVDEVQAAAKEVRVYKIGEAPKVGFSGIVEKEGVVQIVAQTAGIVNSVNVISGQEINRGTVIVNLANNYTGGNAAGVQAGIASAQYKNAKDTYDAQKEIIENQRQLARETGENSEQLRLITEQSVSETGNLITLNASVIVGLEENLSELEQSNVGGVNDAAILSTRQMLTQARSSNNQLYQTLRNVEYQAGEENPPVMISETNRDLVLRQLDVQDKALALSLETNRLQSALAYINASVMAPASPFKGIVENVSVVPGQSVTPGMVLATVAAYNQKATVKVRVPKRIIDNLSKVEASTLFVSGKSYEVVPFYVSSEATDGLLYTITYALPEELVGKITDRDFIQVDIPVGYPDAIETIPYLPIDVIYQTQSGAYVYVIEGGKVVSKNVVLGDVVGGTVAINSGLSAADSVILNRNVIEGENVEVIN